MTSFAYLEAKGKSKIWMAYAEYCSSYEILEEGFNPNSGYVYLALDGFCIASAFGQDVVYMVDDNEFNTFEDMEDHLNEIHQ